MIKILFITLILTVSCGKNNDIEQSEYESALEALDSKQYDIAVLKFLRLSKQYPTNSNYRSLLADSYMGVSGFESGKFFIGLEQISEKDFKKNFNFFRELHFFLLPFLTLSPHRLIAIKKALQIYLSLTSSSELNPKEGHMKLAFGNIYLLISQTQSMIEELSKFIIIDEFDRQTIDLQSKEAQKLFFYYLDTILNTIFLVNYNLQMSYTKLEVISNQFEQALEAVIGPDINLSFNSTNVLDFLNKLLKKNLQIYNKIYKLLDVTCNQEQIITKLQRGEEYLSKLNIPRYNYIKYVIQELKNSYSDELCHYLPNNYYQ